MSSEHVELRSALRLRTVPDYTTLYRFLLRFEKEDVARVMSEIVRRMHIDCCINNAIV
ncbi:MAG: hypothetical protein WCE63_12075 [Acidobacteriaceae bacterium]